MKNKQLQEVLTWINKEMQTLKHEISAREKKIKSLQNLVEGLKAYETNETYKIKYEDLSEQYAQEKERLLELNSIFEEKDLECKNLKNDVKMWQDWIDSNRNLFDKLLSSAPPANILTPSQEKPAESFISAAENEGSTPFNKKKLKFKK